MSCSPWPVEQLRPCLIADGAFCRFAVLTAGHEIVSLSSYMSRLISKHLTSDKSDNG